MKPNRMKAKMLAGEPACGCSVMFPSPQIVEMIGHAGFDWVLLDCEHGSLSLSDVELMAMAADSVGITAIGRPRSNSSTDIQGIMDRGVMGVQVPHVNTVEDAQAAVSAVKFGGHSGRGLAAGTRPDSWGLGGRMPNFVTEANAQTLVCVQLEHELAIRNVEEILTVERVDVFFIGPSDLSQSMGHPGNPKAPSVEAAIKATLDKIKSAGKLAGMPANAENVSNVVHAGVRYVYTHFPQLIRIGATAYLGSAAMVR